MAKKIILFILLMTLLMSILMFSTLVFADEVEDNSENPTKYEEAKDQASQIVEKMNLAEYLKKYFEEDVVSAIISAVVCVIAVIILLSGFIVFAIKMYRNIKANGLTTEALQEVGKEFVAGTKEMKKAVADMNSSVDELKAQNEALRKGFEEYKKQVVNALANDPTLTKNGTADKILGLDKSVEA